MRKYYFIDLFCGAGGLSKGLQMSGLTPLLAVDCDRQAIQTYSLNHPQTQTFCGNIQDLTDDYLKKVISAKKIFLLAGGPPCQGFSTIGPGDPHDPKNQLFQQYLRILHFVKPKYFLFENVTGILAKKNEFILQKIISSFKKEGYSVNMQVISAHHFGVPQRRKRTIIMGSRGKKPMTFPTPLFDIYKNKRYIPAINVQEAFAQIPLSLNKQTLTCSLRDKQIIKYIPPGKGIRYAQDEGKYLPFKLNIDWNKLPEKRLRETKYFRLNPQLPSPTIQTSNNNFYHPSKNRKLTLRELATIQSFPLDFVFCGTLTAQIRQIGNAVPPLLAKHLGKQLLRIDRKSGRVKRKSIACLRKSAFNYSLND